MDLFTNWPYWKEQIIQLKQVWISVKLNAIRQVKIYLYTTDMKCIVIRFLLNKKYLMKTKFQRSIVCYTFQVIQIGIPSGIFEIGSEQLLGI